MFSAALLIYSLVILTPVFVMVLWNLTMPEILKLPQIKFWQAFRLFLLSALLFGGPLISYRYMAQAETLHCEFPW